MDLILKVMIDVNLILNCQKFLRIVGNSIQRTFLINLIIKIYNRLSVLGYSNSILLSCFMRSNTVNALQHAFRDLNVKDCK